MKKITSILFLIIGLTVFAQEEKKKEFIELIDGKMLDAKIIKIRPKFVIAKVGPVEKKYDASQVQSLYSLDYNTVFEGHQVGKKKRWQLLGIYRDGELIVLCELKNMITVSPGYSTMTYNPSSGTMMSNRMGQNKEKSGFWTLEGKTYFRHNTEPKVIIHEASKPEFYNMKKYYCFALMMKLVNGLNSLDLSRDIRNQTYRDLIVKYNNECEAKKRTEEDEREKNKEK